MQSHISLPTDQVDSVHVTTQWEIIKLMKKMHLLCLQLALEVLLIVLPLLADIWFTPCLLQSWSFVYPMYCNTANITCISSCRVYLDLELVPVPGRG